MERIIITPIIDIFDGHGRIFTRKDNPDESDLVYAYWEEDKDCMIVLLDSENNYMKYDQSAFTKYFKLAGQDAKITIMQEYSNEHKQSEANRLKSEIDHLQQQLKAHELTLNNLST